MQGLADSDVFREAIGGDSGAWRSLLGTYRPLLRLVAARHARRMVSHRYDESDVVQVTVAEALRSFRGFQGGTKEELAAWLETILENNLVRMWRTHAAARRDYRRETSREQSSSALSFVWNTSQREDPAQNLLRGEVALLLAQSLELLPDQYRVALEMRFVDGKRIRDVAAQLDTSVGTVAGRLRRGLQMLRELLPAEMQELMMDGRQ